MAVSISTKDSLHLPEANTAASQLMVTAHPDRAPLSTYDSEDKETYNPIGHSVPDRRNEKEMVRHVERGAPGDASLRAMVQRGPEDTERSRQKNKFYGEVFAYREPNSSARDRVARDSVVTAEVKTNVIVWNTHVMAE